MRKSLVFAVSAVLALLAPAAAQAHHVDLNVSTASCALENNAPVVSVKVAYRSFEDFNKPARWELRLDGSRVDYGMFYWPGPDADHRVKHAGHPGTVEVLYASNWGSNHSGGSATMRRTVVCPSPVPPPVLVGCDGNMIPAGKPAPTCPVVTCPNGQMPVGSTCPTPPSARRLAPCVPRRDVVFHSVKGSGTRLGKVKLYVNHRLVRTHTGHYTRRSTRFRAVELLHPGKDGRVPIRIIALLRKADGSALQFRVRDRVKPCGKTIRRDP